MKKTEETKLETMDMNPKAGNKIIEALIRWNRKEITADIAMFVIWEVAMHDDESFGFLLRNEWDKLNEKEGKG